MATREELLAVKRTHLSEKQTELAYERTVMAYIRTAMTSVLFGIAFLGFSKIRFDFFFYAGFISVAFGIILVIVSWKRAAKHIHEIRRLKQFIQHLVSVPLKNGNNHKKH